ncbi:MAG: hypothetical protein U0575_05115 [Phycisphaerales bacterium]
MSRSVVIAPSTVAAVLRREFFARAGSVAVRYGIDPDDVLEFCADGSNAGGGPQPRAVREGSTVRRRTGTSALRVTRLVAHLDDLAHVVACVRGSANAWHDLSEAHEPALVHATRDRLGAMGAVVGVRRWFAALRIVTLDTDPEPEHDRLADHHDRLALGAAPACVHVPGLREDVAVPSLRAYRGLRPLRHWLAERLLGELARQGPTAPARRLRLTSPGVGRPNIGDSSRAPTASGATGVIAAPSGDSGIDATIRPST